MADHAEAVGECAGMEQRVDIVELGARTDLVIRAVGRQIGLGFVGPEGVEALAEDVVADRLPVPCSGVGVGGVDVGPGAVVGQAVDGLAVGSVDEPAILRELIVEAIVGNETRPDADHGFETHVMELLVHRGGIGPELRIHVHLAHLWCSRTSRRPCTSAGRWRSR